MPSECLEAVAEALGATVSAAAEFEAPDDSWPSIPVDGASVEEELDVVVVAVAVLEDPADEVPIGNPLDTVAAVMVSSSHVVVPAGAMVVDREEEEEEEGEEEVPVEAAEDVVAVTILWARPILHVS